MYAFIDAATKRSRAIAFIFLLIFIMGISAYINVPKEHAPEVKIPLIYVSVAHEGISPEDAERLLIRPLEKELRAIEGIKELRANASEGFASVILEFTAGFDSNKALQDVREKVDIAKPELPEDADEPTIVEIDFSMFPVVNVVLVANIPEQSLIKIAKKLRDKIEEIPSILGVNIAGNREEAVDIILDPLLLESYGLTSDIIQLVAANNRLVAAGSLDTGEGRYTVKVPGLLEDIWDVLSLPVKINNDAVVSISDIASVRKTFKDHETFARVNGTSAIVLEVKKRTGENLIETITQVKYLVAEAQKSMPDGIKVIYSQDQSKNIINMLNDLQNNILLATILVMVVIIWFVGIRPSLFVALAIPGSFLMGVLVIYSLGLTLNIVVLFSLILSIGMLVDSAIVVAEDADKQQAIGISAKESYPNAAKRMSWPIFASTITTLLAFAPLLFWPGVVGQFMKYMPLTLIATLSGSLLMALVFIPTFGAMLSREKKGRSTKTPDDIGEIDMMLNTPPGKFEQTYGNALHKVINNAGVFTIIIFTLTAIVFVSYKQLGTGVEFFPEIEPENAQIQVRARGNLSVYEKDNIMQEIGSRIMDMQDEIRVFYNRSGKMDNNSGDLPEDVIGIIQIEFQDWAIRRKASTILKEIRDRTDDMAGIIVEAMKEKKGPSSGKAFQVEVSSHLPEKLEPAVSKILESMKQVGGFVDIEDSRPAPVIEWEMEVNRAQAARFGVTIGMLGNFVKLVTNGLLVTTYRPDDSDDEVDILLRFPEKDRGLEQLDRLRVVTDSGSIPISNFIERKAKAKTSRLERVDTQRVLKIRADVENGVLVDDKVREMKKLLAQFYVEFPDVRVKFKGEDQEQKEAGQFLTGAFILALCSMALVLLLQFNSVYHMLIIMSAVFLSTVGVLLGLLITHQPFGIVMCGVGIISLAGIVVNNNIIFIDTYRALRRLGVDAQEALLQTGTRRLRPILLTAATTVLGLIPMVMAMNINFITREISFDSPSSQWWMQLSTTIAGGLSFATILTLFLTPALIMLGEKYLSQNKRNYINDR